MVVANKVDGNPDEVREPLDNALGRDDVTQNCKPWSSMSDEERRTTAFVSELLSLRITVISKMRLRSGVVFTCSCWYTRRNESDT